MDADKFVTEGMDKIRAAIARAPSHEEVLAGFEAFLRHMVSWSEAKATEATAAQARQAKAEADMKAASDARAAAEAKAAAEPKAAPEATPPPDQIPPSTKAG